jgi:hypothetical protein
MDILSKEDRLELAIQGYERGQFKSATAAAKAFDVSKDTLLRRLRGVHQKRGSAAINRLLTINEEESLVRWILSMDRRGMPPHQASVQQIATLLLTERATAAAPPPIGSRWISRFINRHKEIKSKYNRKYDYQRAKCEDPQLIQAWFQRVQRTIAEYGILEQDIYNFDETGFQMGVIATAKVVTGADRAGRPRTVQPGNREWVTIIETVNTRGSVIPPLIIFEAVMHQSTWYSCIPHDWSIGVSENGWTTNEIGLFWLQNVFEKHTKDRTIGRYRLLILDGHGSHVTPEFDQYCLEHSIIVLCMPPHSSHLLQPLDVGCFAVLKRSYGGLVEQKMGLGINHIDKLEFLPLYQEARAQALLESNIKSGFRATGLAPFNPSAVLSLLPKYTTPSPLQPAVQLPSSRSWIAKTPHNILELQKQTQLLKQCLSQQDQSPPTPTERALDQLVKGCEIAIHNAKILASYNQQLLAENKRQKQKRAQKKSYIAKGGVLSGAEAQSLIAARHNTQDQPVEEEATQRRQRAPPKCSLCGSLLHKANKCSIQQEPV